MNDTQPSGTADLAAKIARLVEERGWNQEDLVRQSGLNRQTVHDILAANERRRLRNTTIGACARALGLTVSELRTQPLERLLPRMSRQTPAEADVARRRLYDQATQPELLAWIERNPERAGRLTADEVDELLSVQATGGPLTAIGVERFVELIERKRQLLLRIHTIAGTEYLDLLERIVELLYDKVRPYRDRQ